MIQINGPNYYFQVPLNLLEKSLREGKDSTNELNGKATMNKEINPSDNRSEWNEEE